MPPGSRRLNDPGQPGPRFSYAERIVQMLEPNGGNSGDGEILTSMNRKVQCCFLLCHWFLSSSVTMI